MLVRKLLGLLLDLTVSPLAIIFFIVLEAEEVAKKMQIKVDKIRKGKK